LRSPATYNSDHPSSKRQPAIAIHAAAIPHLRSLPQRPRCSRCDSLVPARPSRSAPAIFSKRLDCGHRRGRSLATASSCLRRSCTPSRRRRTLRSEQSPLCISRYDGIAFLMARNGFDPDDGSTVRRFATSSWAHVRTSNACPACPSARTRAPGKCGGSSHGHTLAYATDASWLIVVLRAAHAFSAATAPSHSPRSGR